MATVLPDWRKDSKEAKHELDVLADTAREMLDQFEAIRKSINMYLLPFPVTFSLLMEKRFGPAIPPQTQNTLDYRPFTDLQEALEVLVQACIEPLGLPGMPSFSGSRGPVRIQELQRDLVHQLKHLIKPYTEEYDRDEAYAQDIQELLGLIDVQIKRKTIRNWLLGSL